MISTKYRKQQKQKAKDIVAAKRASKDPAKKDKIKGNKKDHKVRMARRNEKIRQRGLFRIAERKRKIEELKRIIEENKQRKLAEENGETDTLNVDENYMDFLKPLEPGDEFSPSTSTLEEIGEIAANLQTEEEEEVI
jgi:hypothetical protein